MVLGLSKDERAAKQLKLQEDAKSKYDQMTAACTYGGYYLEVRSWDEGYVIGIKKKTYLGHLSLTFSKDSKRYNDARVSYISPGSQGLEKNAEGDSWPINSFVTDRYTRYLVIVTILSLLNKLYALALTDIKYATQANAIKLFLVQTQFPVISQDQSVWVSSSEPNTRGNEAMAAFISLMLYLNPWTQSSNNNTKVGGGIVGTILKSPFTALAATVRAANSSLVLIGNRSVFGDALCQAYFIVAFKYNKIDSLDNETDKNSTAYRLVIPQFPDKGVSGYMTVSWPGTTFPVPQSANKVRVHDGTGLMSRTNQNVKETLATNNSSFVMAEVSTTMSLLYGMFDIVASQASNGNKGPRTAFYHMFLHSQLAFMKLEEPVGYVVLDELKKTITKSVDKEENYDLDVIITKLLSLPSRKFGGVRRR